MRAAGYRGTAAQLPLSTGLEQGRFHVEGQSQVILVTTLRIPVRTMELYTRGSKSNDSVIKLETEVWVQDCSWQSHMRVPSFSKQQRNSLSGVGFPSVCYECFITIG